MSKRKAKRRAKAQDSCLGVNPPHDLYEKLNAARQIINAVVAAADAQFEHHYALEHVEDMLIEVAEALNSNKAGES